MYDVVIVGAGVAGLYAAYTLRKRHPTIKFIVLEKSPRGEIGGRVATEMFYDVRIALGAGVGREDTNPLLLQLCRELGIHLDPSHKAVVDYSSGIIAKLSHKNPRVWYLNAIKELRRAYRADKPRASRETFRQFATRVLGSESYKTFVLVSGYSDYEQADVFETLYNYGLDDNTGGWPQIRIPWAELLQALIAAVGPTNIRTSTEVLGISESESESESSSNVFSVSTKSGVLAARHVIVATTIDGIRRLVPNHPKHKDVYDNIHGQPFLRVYAKFDKASAALLSSGGYIQHYTVVEGPLQKIIPISPEKGVYMIAYCDNANALELRDTSKTVFAALVEKALGIAPGSLKILGLREVFWRTGTHFFGPLPPRFKTRREFLDEARHPGAPNLAVVGEAVSTYQGWVEGALESVVQTLL